MPTRYRRRHETCWAIYHAVAASPSPMTRLEISNAISRVKSPLIIEIIEELVVGGYLKREQIFHVNDAEMFVYSLGERKPIES